MEPLKQPKIVTSEGWTVDELRSDGTWVRCATAHWWISNKDACRQRDDLARRWPDKTFAIRGRKT